MHHHYIHIIYRISVLSEKFTRGSQDIFIIRKGNNDFYTPARIYITADTFPNVNKKTISSDEKFIKL